jgi:hypothetical protein
MKRCIWVPNQRCLDEGDWNPGISETQFHGVIAGLNIGGWGVLETCDVGFPYSTALYTGYYRFLAGSGL